MVSKTGIRTAAPVLFRLFDILPDNNLKRRAGGIDYERHIPKNLKKIGPRKNDFRSAEFDSFKIGFPDY